MRHRIVVVDPHPVFVEGFAALLAAQPDLEVVGRATRAHEAATVVEEARPHVVVLEPELGETSGLALTRTLRERHPEVRVLVLAARLDEALAMRAVQAGASGCIGKHLSVEEVLSAVRALAQGRELVAPSPTQRSRRDAGDGPLSVLSYRERDVYELLVRGLKNEEVAQRLGISRRTVETHRAHILQKLRAGSVVDLVRHAASHDLLQG